MHVGARLRLLLVRHPWVWWVAVAVAAAVVAVAVNGAVRRLDDERRSWGERREVWVATVAVAPGEALVAEARSYPLAMIPANALREPPTGVARQRVGAGEVVAVPEGAAPAVTRAVPGGAVVVGLLGMGSPPAPDR
jgi:hypothetical protein